MVTEHEDIDTEDTGVNFQEALEAHVRTFRELASSHEPNGPVLGEIGAAVALLCATLEVVAANICETIEEAADILPEEPQPPAKKRTVKG